MCVVSVLFLRWDSYYPTLSLCFRWNENGENVRLLPYDNVSDSKRTTTEMEINGTGVCQGLPLARACTDAHRGEL